MGRWISQQLTDAEISASEYREGIADILKDTRQRFGPKCVIISNPGVEWSDGSLYWEQS